ncbi:hypothetical protein lerEdw1_008590 [Lerista edwardsae]|nr:hypothetical protein lerEdw1_008590 [Lerista edwardsae]
MADSLLNHSWPSFSRRWMKRWSFKKGSECKSAVQEEFPSSCTSPALGCNSPDTLSPSLIAEDEVFFGSMVEEEEDASSPEPDSCLGTIHSSTEDILSIDSALQGSEYYRDLGFTGSTEVGGVAITTAAQPDQTSWGIPRSCLSAERHRGCEEKLTPDSCPTPTLEMARHYLDADCACSCSTGNQESFVKAEVEHLEDEESFPVLVRSMSTSRRYSWDTPLSPTDAKRRFSLDASELENDTEREGAKENNSLDLSPFLPQAVVDTWSGVGTVIKVEIEPLCLDLGFVQEPANGNIGSTEKRQRSKSVPSPSDSASSPQMSRSLEVSIPVNIGIVPPALEIIEKEHVAPEQMLIVQQVLKELTQYHSAKQRPCAPEGSNEAQQNLTWFEFLSNENEESGKSDKAERSTKVKRRLSSLRNRVTGSWQKEKGKNKDREKEAVEAKEQRQAVHGHELAPGAFSNGTCCSLCGKTLLNKPGLQCLSE